MKRLYIVTGAKGHLGSTIIRLLQKRGETVRGLVLPSQKTGDIPHVHYIAGDVCDKESLRPLFEKTEGCEVYVFHTAGIISIAKEVTPQMYAVNVDGTRNVLALCEEYKVKRLLYVSSVHAIPEVDHLSVLAEVEHFSPDLVVGGYAKTKAEATQAVLDAVGAGKLDAVIVHPSGILGPYDESGNHLVQMVKEYVTGKLPACVKGGYDFVDVRDVAVGCISALEKGKTGQCYILSNRHYEVKEVLGMAKKEGGGRKLPVLPMWVAKAAAPFMEWRAKRKKRRPLYTKYSLYTLSSNDKFSHDKATAELGYKPRDLRQTIADTVTWLKEHRPTLGNKKTKKRRGHKRHTSGTAPLGSQSV